MVGRIFVFIYYFVRAKTHPPVNCTAQCVTRRSDQNSRPKQGWVEFHKSEHNRLRS